MMRRQIKAISQIANDALQRAIAAGGGGGIPEGPGILPAASFLIYVSPGGDDVTGNGTDEFPFKTIAKANAVASLIPRGYITPEDTWQAVLILAMPGTYTENVELLPWVFIGALGAFTLSPFVIQGNVTFDPSWATYTDAIGGLSSCVLLGSFNIQNPGGLINGFLFQSQRVEFNGSVTCNASGPSTQTLYMTTCDPNGTVTISGGANLLSEYTAFDGGTVSILGDPEHTFWVSWGDAVGQGGHVLTIDIDSTLGPVTCELLGTQVSGPLNLTGAAIAYFGSAGAIPPVVNRLAGAPAPTLITEANGIGFTATVPGNWVAPAPVNLHDAVNRIANNTTNVHPIP